MSSYRSRVFSSLWLIFFVNGAVLSSWAPRIPEVKGRLQLTDTELGFALLGIAVGAVPAMALTARLLKHLNDLVLCAVTALSFPALLPLIDRASGLVSLTVVLVLLGATSGGLDVAMNTLAVRLQELWGARVIGRLHGGYSLGVLSGTACAAASIHMELAIGWHFGAVAVVLVMMAGLASSLLCLHAPPPKPHRRLATHDAPDLAEPQRKNRLPVTIGLLAVGCFLIEGLVTDWSVLLLRRDLGAHPTMAASVLTVFSLAMFASRSFSDSIFRRIRESAFLAFAAGVIACALPGAILIGDPVMVAIAVALTGFAIGPIFPLALARGGRASPRNPAGVAARLSIVGYAAYLAGPPLMGFAAETAGLPKTFIGATTMVATTLGVIALAGSSGSRWGVTRRITKRT